MVDLVTSAQMRAIEAAAIESGAVSGLTLMERAGEAVVAAVRAHWPELAAGTQALVLCGPGNNGGDGYVVARLLAARGWRVQIAALGDPALLPPDARAMWREWEALGHTQGYDRQSLEAAAQALEPGQPLVVVDALFGIGLSRVLGVAVTGPWAAFLGALPADADLRLVAVDVPSGLSDAMPEGPGLPGWSKSGQRLTVTFHALKAAHRAMLAAGERVVVADIGLPT